MAPRLAVESVMEEKSEQIETKEPQVSPVKTKHETKPSRYKNIVHLWEFLLEMLADEHCSSLISWSRQNYQEFKLKDKEEVARRWGILKGRRGMNYDKLSRALRYYYRQGIIKKVPGQRLVYRFSKLPYEYIPGVTRSSSLQGQRIPQTVRSQEQGSRDFNDDDNISAFSPTKTPLGRSWSWPVMPGPCQPINYLRSNVADIPPLCYTGSKLIFPIVRHSSLPPEWLGFRPVDRVSQFYKTCPFPRSIPVSVIKPTAQVNLPQWKTI